MTDDLNEPIEIRWWFAHHGAIASLSLLITIPALWQIFIEPPASGLAPFWIFWAIASMFHLVKAIDRRPQIVLTREGLACPHWFAGRIDWSEIDTVGELAFVGKGTPYLVLRPEAADRLRWIGVDVWLRRSENRRRAPILLRAGEMDFDVGRLTAVLKKQVAEARPDLVPGEKPEAAPTLSVWRLTFSPLYDLENALWVIMPGILLIGVSDKSAPYALSITIFLFLLAFFPELFAWRKPRRAASG